MFGLNYDGLRKRETYDEVVDYIQNKQEKIKYPNRLAKRIRDSPQLSNLLDGDGEGYSDMLKQQDRGVEAQEILNKIRKIAETSPLTTNQFNTLLDTKANTQYFDFNEINLDNANFSDAAEEEFKRREIEMANKKRINKQHLNEALGHVSDITGAVAGSVSHITTHATLAAVGGVLNGIGNYVTGNPVNMGIYVPSITMGGGSSSSSQMPAEAGEPLAIADGSVQPPRRSIFSWVLGDKAVTAQTEADVRAFNVDRLRQNYRTLPYDKSRVTNDMIKGVARNGNPGWKKKT